MKILINQIAIRINLVDIHFKIPAQQRLQYQYEGWQQRSC